MSDLVDTTEMFLKAVWEMREDGIQPLRARLAERLDQSIPAVSQTVARLERDGLFVLTDDRTVELTQRGNSYAMRIMRKHRLAKLLLLDVVGLDLHLIHDEACRWEHVMSKQVEKRILALVESPCHDPFGNPIPGLGDLGVREPCQHEQGSVALAKAGEGTFRLVRIGEPAQTDAETLRVFAAAGLMPHAEFSAALAGERWEVSVAGGGDTLTIAPHLAKHLFVQPIQAAEEGHSEGAQHGESVTAVTET